MKKRNLYVSIFLLFFQSIKKDCFFEYQQKKAVFFCKNKKVANYVNLNLDLFSIEKAIPQSIVFAQSILESDYGKSKIAINKNNHFGIRCFSKKCDCGDKNTPHYKRFYSKKDCIEYYKSKVIYKNFAPLLGKNYKDFAVGLQKLGYAEDSLYSKKLVLCIEKYNLYKLD